MREAELVGKRAICLRWSISRNTTASELGLAAMSVDLFGANFHVETRGRVWLVAERRGQLVPHRDDLAALISHASLKESSSP